MIDANTFTPEIPVDSLGEDDELYAFGCDAAGVLLSKPCQEAQFVSNYFIADAFLNPM